MGKSPEGKALKFAHRGSYDSMDNTCLGDHQSPRRQAARGAQDMFVEDNVTDPLKTPEDKLPISINVPLR